MIHAIVPSTVARLLRAHLEEGLRKKSRSNVAVSLVPFLHPTDRELGPGQRLNLCLYDVLVPSPLGNADDGGIYDHGAVVEPRSLDLRFVLSAHGGNELSCEIILGHGMELLREIRRLDRADIRASLERARHTSAHALPSPYLDVVAEDLPAEIEEIEIHLEPGRLQGFDRMWSEVHGPVPPSVPYRVVVRLSDETGREPTSTAALAPERRSRGQPIIERVRSRAAPNLPIVDDPFVTSGQQLVLDGRFPAADDVRVRLDYVEISPSPEDVTNARIAVTVPMSLRAGVRQVVVACAYTPRSPGVRSRIATSNLSTFVLQPLVDPWSIAVEDGYISLAVKPKIGGDQHVSLLLNEWDPSVQQSHRPQAYVLHIPPRTSDSDAHEVDRDEVVVPIADVPPGEYLVRLQVDGAKSPLSVVDGHFAFPRVTLP